MTKHKIIAITQIHNELRKGHLERFFKYLPSQVDQIVIYDDASTDGSWEYAKKFTPHVIRGKKNDFQNEWQHKQVMLEKAVALGADFILAIDADEVVSGNNGEKLQKLADWVIAKNLDGALMRNINLWRSVSWARVDNDFDKADFLRFWRVQANMGYANRQPGLHQSPAPDSVKNYSSQDLACLLHFGFAEERSIIAKYLQYGVQGQQGVNLSRLIDESQLALRPVDSALFPDGLYQTQNQPQARPAKEWLELAQQLKPDLMRPAISIVALIYKSTDWLKFSNDQVLKYTDMSDKEFFFVANDAAADVKKYLVDNCIPHHIFDNTAEHQKEWYINNVYRAWNYGGFMAKGDYILFVNSDMAFTPNWVENLFVRLDGHNCVGSRLVESGKLGTGGLNIEKNFGKLIEEYQEQQFQEYARQISENKIMEGGAFMPLLIKREDFMAVNGYPEGNVVPGSDIFNPKIAEKGQELVSGDIVLMEKLKQRGIIHQTAYDSLSYHFQEGEMTSPADDFVDPKRAEILVVEQDSSWRNSAKVAVEALLALPITSLVSSRKDDLTLADLKNNFPKARLVLAENPEVFADLPFDQICLLEVGSFSKNKISLTNEVTLGQAKIRVSGSVDLAANFPEYFTEINNLGHSFESWQKFWRQILTDYKLRHYLPVEYEKFNSKVGQALWQKKIMMMFGNKNYINVYLKKKLPQPIYTFFLSGWRLAKKLKIYFKFYD